MSSSAALEGADLPARTPVTIPVICGPTASGKSAITSWLSQRRELLVISADSRQVYRDFDIGTAKPSREERRKVPHRGIDVVGPAERYSAADFAAMATAAIAEAFRSSRIPVIVGGTGFYIGALFRPLWAQPPIDAERRQALQRLLDGLSLEDLRRWCLALDLARAHLGRTQLLRAIEVALLTGQRLSDLHVEHARPRAYVPSYLLVDPATELPARIAARALAMLETGWPEEVRRLIADVPPDAPAWKATGYGVVRTYVQGGLDRSAALEQLIIETRQYAKRQRTWFRHQLDADRVQRLAPTAPGWQEQVDRWITDVERQQRDERVSRGEHAR